MLELNDEQRAYYAKELLDNPLFAHIMDTLEADAINSGVYAKLTDHEAHQAAMAEVRAVRNFRQACEAFARKPPDRKAPPA